MSSDDIQTSNAPITDVNEISQLIEGAKQGSMERIHELGIRIGQLYDGYSENILDALLPHLTFPEDGYPTQCGPTFMAMSALTQVNTWHKLYAGRSGFADALSRIVAVSDDCVSWAKELLETLVLDPNSPSKTALSTHSVVSWFIYSLFKTPTTIFTTLAKREHTLELALRFWVASCDGAPIIYSGGKHPNIAYDCGIAMVYEITAENPRGVADAIMRGRVCSPEEFLERSIERLRSLAAMDKVKHLSTSPPALGVEKQCFECVLAVVHILTGCEPQLGAVAMEKGFYKHSIESLVSLLRRLVNGAPQAGAIYPVDTATKSHTLEILDLAERLINNITDTSTQVVRKMRAALDGGLLALLGISLPVVIRDNEQMFDSLLKSVTQYATYPGIIKAIARDFPTAISPKVRFLHNAVEQRIQIRSMMEQLRPVVQMCSRRLQEALCDNIKHSDRTGRKRPFRAERTCSKCHTVVYCSRACQGEDWDMFHRGECPHMRKQYLDHKGRVQGYPYLYRKFHTNLVRHFYEGSQVLRRTWIQTGTSKKTDYVPDEVDQAVVILPRDQDVSQIWGTPVDMYAKRTADLGVIAPYLVPRFNAFIAKLGESVSKSRAQGGRPAHIAGGGPILNDGVGAIRLAERAFRWGDMEINILVLLKQTRVVPYCTATTDAKAEEKAARFFHRDVGGKEEPLFTIVSSMAYECKRRHFMPMPGSISKDEWRSAYLNAAIN